jgi:hypothetical protein
MRKPAQPFEEKRRAVLAALLFSLLKFLFYRKLSIQLRICG